MKLRNTILTGAASYIQMGTIMITQLVAIPVALRFLDNERFGLWSFTSQSLGYLMLLDFGVTNSIGRLLVEPLHTGDEKSWNGWFNLILAVLTIQAVVMLGVGLALADPILHWFNIPPSLFAEARQLWLMVLVINAVAFPSRLLPGILATQNRYYWFLLSNALSAVAGLGAFCYCLKIGSQSLSYGLSLAVQILVNAGLTLVAVMCGPHRFRISVRGIPWRHARELFGYSSAVFLIGIAGQILFMSQSLIITKILGLGAVASFTVCNRVPILLMQLIERPFDAFLARWQILWAKSEMASLSAEVMRMLPFTMGLALMIMTCSLAMNRWFVVIFGKQQLYIGKEFDFFYAVFVITQVWTHCLSFSFMMAKRVNMFAFLLLLDTVIGIVVTIVGTKFFGLTGYIAFTAIYGLVGIAFWYNTLKAPEIFGLTPRKLFQDTRRPLVSFSALLIGSLVVLRQASAHCPAYLTGVEIGVVAVAVGMFIYLFRNDLWALVRQAKLVSHRPDPVPAPL